MKILLVNASDAKGGAAIVAHRLLHALNAQEGVQAKMLVAEKSTDDENVTALPKRWWLKKALDRMVIWAFNGFTKQGLWLTDGGFFGNDITKRREFQEADVIHLHWVNQGFLGLKDIKKILKSGKKVVWTMHDMWPATAVCHHAGNCDKYKTTGCKCCEQLRFPYNEDFSAKVWKKKSDYYRNSNIHFVACSSWMADHERQSLLTRHLPVTVIPNVAPVSDVHGHSKLNTGKNIQTDATNRRTICFAAAKIDDKIKGFDDLLEALNHIKHRKDVELVLIGGISDKSLLNNIPIPYRYLGYQRDMMSIYAAADCVVNCSRYETLPTTIVEAQSVGTTPVAYSHSGAIDLITDNKTGYLAEYRNTESLAKAIERAIDNPLDAGFLRKHVEDSYNENIIAHRHIEIYCSNRN
ncbi:MAG: glycosyltransferase [Bacteroidaceae bacterium]|nr:glycosyltransferase [Bacteroidaceae bacterium]